MKSPGSAGASASVNVFIAAGSLFCDHEAGPVKPAIQSENVCCGLIG
jgi:hypothetical protein